MMWNSYTENQHPAKTSSDTVSILHAIFKDPQTIEITICQVHTFCGLCFAGQVASIVRIPPLLILNQDWGQYTYTLHRYLNQYSTDVSITLCNSMYYSVYLWHGLSHHKYKYYQAKLPQVLGLDRSVISGVLLMCLFVWLSIPQCSFINSRYAKF